MSDNLREWTVLVYFAADNDLDPDAVRNLGQLEAVGASDQIHVLAQLDHLDPFNPATRTVIKVGGGVESEEEVSPDPNTGSVQALLDFIEWAAKKEEHTAKRYLIVIWGHGNGTDDDEDHEEGSSLEIISSLKVETHEVIAISAAMSGAETSAEVVPAPVEISSTDVTISIPEIALDSEVHITNTVTEIGLDESESDQGDALTCKELKRALTKAKEFLGGEVHVIGFDACLMGLVEIAQQVSDSMDLMIASQETIPSRSWPYDLILRRLITEPTMDARKLGEAIVDEYVNFYKAQGQKQVSLSACDLSQIGSMAEAVRQLGGSLRALVPHKGLRRALVEARRNTQSFLIRDYMDLFHFCSVLQKTLSEKRFKTACENASTACADAQAACQLVMSIIYKDDKSGFVVHARPTSDDGSLLANAHGISIYFPMIAPLYTGLDLSERTKWDVFLHEYANTLLRPKEDDEKVMAGTQEVTPGAPLQPDSAPQDNGHKISNLGGTTDMSSNATEAAQKIPCLALFKGMQVLDVAKGINKTLNGLSFIEMGADRKVSKKGEADLDVPQKGQVKASLNTSTKFPSGTRFGTPGQPPPSVEISLPACTLREPSAGNLTTELGQGAKIITKAGGASLVVLEEIELKVK
jgi:hypothetical protein